MGIRAVSPSAYLRTMSLPNGVSNGFKDSSEKSIEHLIGDTLYKFLTGESSIPQINSIRLEIRHE
jgi:hypothetical protein